MRNKIFLIGLGAISFLLSMGVGLYVYRYLWNHLDSSMFVAWFMLLEISQFLLLLDLGFSHKFIRSNSNKISENFFVELGELRFKLGAAGVLISLMIGFISNTTLSGQSNTTFMVISLIASSLFSIISYAETAALRVKEMNASVYVISIVAQIVFVAFLVLLPNFGLINGFFFAFATRSILMFLLQVIFLKIPYKIYFPKKFDFGGWAVAMNVSYFTAFMLDVFIMKLMGVTSIVLGTFLVYRKIFDIVRSFIDYMIPNLFKRFAQTPLCKDMGLLTLFILSSYACGIFGSFYFIELWLPDFEMNKEVAYSVGIYMFSISIFRLITLKSYYRNIEKASQIFVPVILMKLSLSFALFVNSSIDMVVYSYFLQALILIMVSFGGFLYYSRLER